MTDATPDDPHVDELPEPISENDSASPETGLFTRENRRRDVMRAAAVVVATAGVFGAGAWFGDEGAFQRDHASERNNERAMRADRGGAHGRDRLKGRGERAKIRKSDREHGG